MKDFELQVREEVESYTGEHEDLLRAAPYFYRWLTRLLDDPELPGRLRPLVLVTVAYFLLPIDVASEDLTGPRGYLDDIFLVACTARRLQETPGASALLERCWEGPGPFLPLVERILRSETALVGDRREVILWYAGWEHLPRGLDS